MYLYPREITLINILLHVKIKRDKTPVYQINARFSSYIKGFLRRKFNHFIYTMEIIFVINILLQVFPKIKRDEALVYHGTEFPIGEEHRTMNFTSLHQLFLITDNVTVSFEVLHGLKFSVISPPKVCYETFRILYFSKTLLRVSFEICSLFK